MPNLKPKLYARNIVFVFLLALSMDYAVIAYAAGDESATYSYLLESYCNQLTNTAAVATQLSQRPNIRIENAPLCEYLNKNPKDTILRERTIDMALQYANPVTDWNATLKNGAGFAPSRHSKTRVLWAWQVLFQLNVLHDGMSYTNALQILGEPNRGRKEGGEDLTNRIWWEHPLGVYLFAHHQTNVVLFDPIFGRDGDPWIGGGNQMVPPLTEAERVGDLLRSLREQLANSSIAWAHTPDMSTPWFAFGSLLAYVRDHSQDSTVRDEILNLARRYANAEKQSLPPETIDSNVSHHTAARVIWAWQMLFELDTLHDGMTLAEATTILGTPRRRQSGHLMWYLRTSLHAETKLEATDDGTGLVFLNRNERPPTKKPETNKVPKGIDTKTPNLQP